MLKLYCQNIETPNIKLMLETEDWAEIINFLNIIVSAHGYEYKYIQDFEIPEQKIIKYIYSDKEFCFITAEEQGWEELNINENLNLENRIPIVISNSLHMI